MNPTGAGTPHFNEKLADQKVNQPSAPAKAFNKTQLGSGEFGPIWRSCLGWFADGGVEKGK